MQHLPNVLTVSRIIAAPILLWMAAAGHSSWFAALLFVALLSDVLDGAIARRFGLQTPAGGMLDSVADALLLLTLPIACLVLYPELREREWGTVLTIYLAYVLPIGFGFVKFRRLTSYHTIGARIAAVVLGFAFFSMVVWQVTWPLRLAAVVVVVAELEEILITWILPQWKANIPSLWHARRVIGMSS